MNCISPLVGIVLWWQIVRRSLWLKVVYVDWRGEGDGVGIGVGCITCGLLRESIEEPSPHGMKLQPQRGSSCLGLYDLVLYSHGTSTSPLLFVLDLVDQGQRQTRWQKWNQAYRAKCPNSTICEFFMVLLRIVTRQEVVEFDLLLFHATTWRRASTAKERVEVFEVATSTVCSHQFDLRHGYKCCRPGMCLRVYVAGGSAEKRGSFTRELSLESLVEGLDVSDDQGAEMAGYCDIARVRLVDS